MKFPQEAHATALHKILLEHFASARSLTDLSITGAGVHWDCIAKRASRSCSIHCFDVRGPDGVHGPEYLASFDEGDQTIAMGRTSLDSEIVPAVSDWLQGASLDTLHSKFRFVDGQKRDLLDISKSVTSLFPELQTTAQVKHDICDLHSLMFALGDRGCKVSYYGKNPFPDAFFQWDQCELFRFPIEDISAFATVLKRWVCDHAMPSAMRAEFPWIKIGDVANYYERGQPIEGEFIHSWERIEKFYSEMSRENFPVRDDVLNFIRDLRQRGYDKTLRAGQSMFSMILSRSRRHGLRNDQLRMIFNFSKKGIAISSQLFEAPGFGSPKIAVTPELETRLKTLLSAEVD